LHSKLVGQATNKTTTTKNANYKEHYQHQHGAGRLPKKIDLHNANDKQQILSINSPLADRRLNKQRYRYSCLFADHKEHRSARYCI